MSRSNRYAFPALMIALCLGAASAGHAANDVLPAAVRIEGIEFVRIPAGDFWHTVPIDDHAKQRGAGSKFRTVRVWLDDFYIARHEARATDYARFLNSGAAVLSTPKTIPGGELKPVFECTVVRQDHGFQLVPGADNLPATNVSWFLADGFARWLGFRLPTEAEWTKAARGPDRRAWPWGDEYPDDTHAHFLAGSGCQPAAVDAHPKGRSPYGIFNMAGNVAEWVADWFSIEADSQLRNGVRNPQPGKPTLVSGADAPRKIVKGGRWGANAEGLLIHTRRLSDPDAHNTGGGVRFAIDASTVQRRLREGSAIMVGDALIDEGLHGRKP